jgi:hypothetical protein
MDKLKIAICVILGIFVVGTAGLFLDAQLASIWHTLGAVPYVGPILQFAFFLLMVFWPVLFLWLKDRW